MGLKQRIVPTLGALVCAAGAYGLDLGPEGGLSITGYVDVIATYNRYGANAPRSGVMDNAGLWDRAYTEGLPYSVNYLAPSLTIEAPLGIGGDPTWNYTGGGGNPAGSYDGFMQTMAPVPWVQYVYDIKGEEQQDLDFATFAELDFAYKVLPGVVATVEVRLDDSTDVSLFGAYVDWELPHGFAFKAGKFTNWLGWEAIDPRGMNRVNHSNQWAMTGVQVDGVKLSWSGGDEEKLGYGLAVDVVDTVYGDPLGTKDGDDLAFAVEGSVNFGGVLSLGGSVTLDKKATVKRSAALKAFEYGTLYPAWGWVDLTTAPVPGLTHQDFLTMQGSWREDVLGVNLFGTIDPDGEDGFTIGFDAHWIDYDLAQALGLMGTVSYKIPGAPVTLTAMVSWYDPNTEGVQKYYAPTPGPLAATGVDVYTFNNGEDDEELEFALAVLTNPTGNPNYGVNLEVRYIQRKDLDYNPVGLPGVKIEDRSELGVFLEFLAILP